MEDKGKVLTLYFLDGNINGVLKISAPGETCVAFKINRDDLDKYKNRKELKQSGIYFLFGAPNDKNTKDIVYVGQANERKNGEGILNRLVEHKRNPNKDYWNYAIVFTTTDNSLNSTGLNYLENYFCNLAKEANRYIVKNGNDPSIGNISEEQVSSLRSFISNTEFIMSALNYKIFVPIIDSEENCYYLERKNRETGITIKATGQKTKDGFVVLRGSYIAEKDMKVIYPTVKEIRKKAKINKNRILQEDLLFSSPTYAAAFVIGSNANGLTEWKTKDGVKLKDLINEE